MNVDSILDYKADPNEDFYALLGCDPSASSEQIIAEFKARARDVHPDKNSDPKSQELFQRLLKAKVTLVDPKERGLYDAWRSAGIAMTFAQWRSLKDSVKASMHWATPKTSGRMLDIGQKEPSELVSLNPSPVKEEDLIEVAVHKRRESEESDDHSDVTYEPTPYESLGLRIATPPPGWLKSEENKENAKKPAAADEKEPASTVDSATAMKRRQFAIRRESTIGAMVMAEKWDDNEIRRRFRNYEI